MVFKNLCIILLWTKVALVLEGLIIISGHLCCECVLVDAVTVISVL